MENVKRTANILADKALLAMLASNEDVKFSKARYQIVMDVLAKVTLPSSLDSGILRKIFECLRSWSSALEVFSIVPLLANVYDNLLHRDLGQSDVSDCLCELLFLIEDMSDHQQCKVIAGEHFLQRLLALAGSKLTGIKLQRVAVETLSSILLMCPRNQKIVLDNLNSEWHKLFKQVLPHCGDFFVQASIVEIFYRLSKRSSRLLDWLEDSKLREKMLSLHQTKKPDLHAETRKFLDHLNQSLGCSRSVYSFLAKDIILDGQSTPLKDEKWVHFGLDHMSCYAALDSDSVGNNTSLVDVMYTQVCDLQVRSNDSLDITFRELLPSGQDAWIRVKTVKLSLVLKSKEMETIMDYVLPRINHLQNNSQKGGSKESDSENTTATASFSAKMERSFRKASVGFAIPLPRKFKLPSLPNGSNEQNDLKEKACKDHIDGAKVADNKNEGQLLVKENLQKQAQDEVICNTGHNGNWSTNYGVDASMKSSTRVSQLPDIINQENIAHSPACQSAENKVSFQANKEPGLKQEKLSSLQGVDNCKNFSPICKTSNSIAAVEKIADKFSSTNRKDTFSNLCSNAGPTTVKVGYVSHVPRRSSRRTGSAMVKEDELCRLPPMTAPIEENDAEQTLRPGNVGKTSNDNERSPENVVQSDPVSKCGKIQLGKAAACDEKVADSKQVDSLQERILNILKKANLPESDADDTTKQKHSTSDPIETDSEQKKPVSDNENLAKAMSKKAGAKQKKKGGGTYLNQEAAMTPKYTKRKTILQGEKAGKIFCKKQVHEKDVFCFEEDQQCKAAEDMEGKCSKVSKSNHKDDDHLTAFIYTDTAPESTRLLKTTTSELFTVDGRKSKDDDHLADLVQTNTAARSTRLLETNPNKLLKVGYNKSKDDNDNLAVLARMDPAAISTRLLETAPNKLFKISNSKSKDDHLTDLVLTDTATISPRSLEATPNKCIKVADGIIRKNNNLADLTQTNTATNSAKLETISSKPSRVGHGKSKDNDHLADLTETDTPDHSTKLLETIPKRLFKVGNDKSRDDDNLVDFRQVQSAVNPVRLLETTPYEPFKVSNNKIKDSDSVADIVQNDTVVNPATLLGKAPSNVMGFDDARISKNVCHLRERKRDLEINITPSKRIKCSPEEAGAKSLNDGLQCSVFARQVLSSFDRTESTRSGGKNECKDDRNLPAVYYSPKETRKEQINGGKQRFAVRPKSASLAKHAPQTFKTLKKPNARDQKHAGRTKKSFDVLLQENVQPTESVDGDAMADGEMQLVAALVQKIMKKIKVKTQNKSAQILSNAKEAVQQCCQEVQGQIQSDLDESTKLCQETFEKLQLQLQEEQEAFLETQKKWKEEFSKHVHRFKEISSKADSSHGYLKSVSDKLKTDHAKIFLNLNEFVESHLIETERKLIALQKGAAGHRNELKGALLQIF